MPTEFKKANTLAVAGFLTPLVAAGIVCALLLIAGDEFKSSWIFMVYQMAVPVILIIGLVLGVKSIPQIDTLGDKDYAYTGLFLNIFFLAVFFLSLIYLH